MEEYLSLAEVKEILEREKRERGELGPEQGYSLAHAGTFARIGVEEARTLVKELLKLQAMSPLAAYKIVDLLPTHVDDVRSIFAKERVVPDKAEVERILEMVGKNL